MQESLLEKLRVIAQVVISLFVFAAVLYGMIKILRSRAWKWVKVLSSTVAVVALLCLGLYTAFWSVLAYEVLVQDSQLRGQKPRVERWAYHVSPDGAQSIVWARYWGVFTGYHVVFAYRATPDSDWKDGLIGFEDDKWKNAEIVQTQSNTLEIVKGSSRRRVVEFDPATYSLSGNDYYSDRLGGTIPTCGESWGFNYDQQ